METLRDEGHCVNDLKMEPLSVLLTDQQLLCNLMHHQVVSTGSLQEAVGTPHFHAIIHVLEVGCKPLFLSMHIQLL